MRSSFATRTIMRLRYPMIEDQGVEVYDYSSDPTMTPIAGCWYEPISSTVDLDGRTAVRTGYTVDAPAGIDLTEHDRVLIEMSVQELDGRPLAIPSPTGQLDSTKFTTSTWEG